MSYNYQVQAADQIRAERRHLYNQPYHDPQTDRWFYGREAAKIKRFRRKLAERSVATQPGASGEPWPEPPPRLS